MKHILLILILTLTVPSFANYGWYMTPTNTTTTVGGISMISSTRAIAVGFGGLLRSTTNGGATWLFSSAGVSSNLHKVLFINSNVGTIVGAEGVLLHTTNGGNSWVQISLGITSNINDIAFVKSGGEYTNLGFIVGINGLMYKTTDGGSSWASQNSGTSTVLDNIFVVNANTIYATGLGGTVIKTTNGGLNWFSANPPSGNNYYGVSFFDENTGVICAGNPIQGNWVDGKIYKTTNGGLSWTLKLSYPSASLHIPFYHSINSITVVGAQGKIFKSVDGGNFWALQDNQSPNFLYDVDFADSLTGMAVGEGGTIVKTITGGLTGISEPISSFPDKFDLSQNYPNPFNPTTNINISIIKSGNYSLNVYDVEGSLVSSVFNKQLSPGNYSFTFNGNNTSSAVYFYKLSDGINSLTRKMLLVK
ncbi:hypothetical protein BH10BAC5_BH10BAC5_09670 [soil metagenome]